MASHYRTEHIREVPHGWKVRTVISGRHRVRVAFPPGPRVEGAGIRIAVLHPSGEKNPCPNPAELVLLGANPIGARAARERAAKIRAARLKNPYDRLSVQERLAFGRLGLGRAQLQSASDIRRARAQVKSNERFRNRLPNPGLASEDARELAAEFKHAPSDEYQVYDEPHVPRGNYARLGMFAGIAIKPNSSSTSQVQELSFPNGASIRVVDKHGREFLHPASDVVLVGSYRHQLYLVEAQPMTESEIAVFGGDKADPCLLGEARAISYITQKWHPQVSDAIRGKNVIWEHPFGDKGGRKPELWYSRSMKRLRLGGGDYTIEGVGIKN